MNGLNCLITGASTGVGKEISIELSKFSDHIYITSRNIQALEQVHDEIVKNNCKCTIVPLDLLDKNGIENLARQIFKKDKLLDILILAAGAITQLSPINSINIEEAKEILNLNYFSNLRIIKNFHPLLINSNNANLGIISSERDTYKEQYWGIYQPVMSALNELVLSYAIENKNTKIKANIFCPKAVNTKFRENIMPGENKGLIKEPQEVAKFIVDYILKTKDSGNVIKI